MARQCRKKVLGVCVSWFTDPLLDPVRSIRDNLNPVRAINNNTNINIKAPTVKIGGTSIGLDPVKQAQASLRDLKNTKRQSEKDWANAGKGEVGKWASGYAQSVYNIAAAPVNVATGKSTFKKESQKTLGGFQNLAGVGTDSYLGQSSTFQRVSRDENLVKNSLGVSKNYAGTARGTYTLNNSGTLSNEDRVDMQQLGVKAAVVVAAAVGGAAALGGGAAPAAGGGSSAAIAPLGTTGAAASGTTAAAAGTTTAAAGGTAAAATSSTPWWAYLTTGSGLLGGISGLGGKPSLIDVAGDQLFPPGGGDGGGSAPAPSFPSDLQQPYYNDGNPLPEVLANLLPQTEEGKMLLWTGVATGFAIYLWSRR